MKHNTYLILCLAASLIFGQTLAFFDVSFAWTLLLIPAFCFAQMYAGNRYSYRESLALEDIPASGYEDRLNALQQNKTQVEQLGFEKFDDFYLRTTSDIVGFAYLHETKSAYLCDYHIGVTKLFDVITRFDNGVTLTTANSKYVGKTPPLEQCLLQNFVDAPLEQLIREHFKSVRFLEQRGFRSLTLEREGFRPHFLDAWMKYAKQARSPLHIPKFLYYTATSYDKRLHKSIREQELAGTIENIGGSNHFV